MTLCPFAGAAAAALLFLADGASAATLAIDGKAAAEATVGDTVTISISGAPGVPVVLLFDLAPGPVTLLDQSVDIGFTASLVAVPVGNLSPAGSLDVMATVPEQLELDGATVYCVAAVLDPAALHDVDFSDGASIALSARRTELAGNPLAQFPFFEHVKAFNQGGLVSFGLDTSRIPALAGVTADVYVTAAKDKAGWLANPALADLTATGKKTVTFAANTIGGANTFVLDTGVLSGAAGIGLGVGYDVVIDVDRDGVFEAGDWIDGMGGEAGLYVVHDTTQPGAFASVVETMYTGGTFLGQDTYYPANIAALGELPLVVISHGNGHNYTWYDHIGFHLASYGFIVMSHQNNTQPGVESASGTTLSNVEWFLANLASIDGGALVGHVDKHKMTWIGHSRGGEGVVRAYDRVFDGTYAPVNFALSDVVLISSMAPTDFLGTNSANPHGVAYHLWTGVADNDVNGCASSDVGQTFHLHERATGWRQATQIYGAGHGDFHASTGSVASGPCLIGKPATHLILTGYLLPLVQRYVRGNVPAEDFLWRQWESFHPIGAPVGPCVVVDLMYREAPSAAKFVVDNFQANASTALSSSGGSVSFVLNDLREGLMNDANTTFTDGGGDVWNGFTLANGSGDSASGLALMFDGGGESRLTFGVVPAAQDTTRFRYLSFRASQVTRAAQTFAVLGDVTFDVVLKDAGGNESSINIGAWGGGIEEPYQRTSCGTGTGWANDFETVRIRLADFANNGNPIDLSHVTAIEFRFGPAHGSFSGKLGFDDLELTAD